MKHKKIIQALIVLVCFFDSTYAQVPQFTRIDTGALVRDIGNSQGSSIADFDNDGDVDLLIGNTSSFGPSRPVLLYKNERKGYFTKIQNGDLATQDQPKMMPTATFVDIDNDGDWDVSTPCIFYLNDGYGVFTKEYMDPENEEGCGDQLTSWVDINNDGYLDCAIWSQLGRSNQLFLNNGDGYFSQIVDDPFTTTPLHSESLLWADIDNDGDMDIFSSNFSFLGSGIQDNRNSCFINEDGSFTMMGNTATLLKDTLGSGGGSWGDYDNDGDLDLYVAAFRGTNHLYQNKGSGDFDQFTIDPVEAIDLGFMGSAWGDFDNDGDLDLFVTSDLNDAGIADFANFNMLFENNGDGSFTEVATGNLKTDGGHSCSLLDYDNDGDLDILVPNGSLGSPFINYLYSNNGNNNKWININCRGRISNTSAIGTRVWIKANINGQNVTQMRELTQQTGLHSISSPRFHFGLGDAEIADSIIIRWPLGHIDTILNVPVNQFYLTIEDSVLVVDFKATNYIQLSRPFDIVSLESENDSIQLDLSEYFSLVTGDTVPEFEGDTLTYTIRSIENPDVVSVSIDPASAKLTLKAGTAEGTSNVEIITSAGFTRRLDQFNVTYIAALPELSLAKNTVEQGDPIIATSTKDGMIFLVNVDTPPDLVSILFPFSLIDSLTAKANIPVEFPTVGLSVNDYWLYAVDIYGFISKPDTVTIVSGTGVEENINTGISIYPNPAHDLIIIETNKVGQYSIELNSINGQLIYSTKMEGPTHQIDLSSFQKGVYFITIRSRDFVKTEKIIKL